MNYFTLFALALCIAAAVARVDPQGTDCRGCERFTCAEYKTRTIQRRVCTKYEVKHYRTRCGLFGWGRCGRTRNKCASYKIVPTTIRQCIREQFNPHCRCDSGRHAALQ